MNTLIKILKWFWLSLQKPRTIPKVIEYVPPEIKEPKEENQFPKPLGWKGTKREVENEVRRVCKDENMPDNLTQEVLCTIAAESYFSIDAIFKNKNGTEDLGLCQYNTYWYIGKGKPIPDRETALNDPEFCVRVMCRQFKRGNQKDWIAWKSGSYLRFMKNGRFASPF
jgi:hypothetical protein